MDWFKSYLHGRKQFVQYKESSSDILNIECGVPQGSVLGPLLFIIYSNDLPKSVKSSKTILFADDTTIYVTGPNKNRLFSDIRKDLELLIDWFRANKLSLNISKTNYILFKPKHMKNDDTLVNDSDNILKFGSELIDQKDHVKFLGLLIDQYLDWSYQSRSVTSKLSSSLYMMNSVKNFLPMASKINLYYSFFYSYMSYGILVWGPNISSFFLDKITKQQKRAVRIIKNVKVNAHTDLIFKELSVLKVNEVINLENLKLIFNVYRNSTPDPICEIFSSSASQHTYLTRHRHDPVFAEKRNYSAIQNSFICRGPSLWSNLDNSIKNSPSSDSFARNYKRYILS